MELEPVSRKLAVAGLQLKKDPDDQEVNLAKLEKTAHYAKARYPWIDLIFTG